METRVKPLRENMQLLLSHFDHFYTEPVASQIVMDREVFDIATELRAKHGLKTPDALHLAAALRGECTEFWTNDRHLEAAADGRIAIVTFN
jgi:predicted nucleic acid-binding protein